MGRIIYFIRKRERFSYLHRVSRELKEREMSREDRRNVLQYVSPCFNFASGPEILQRVLHESKSKNYKGRKVLEEINKELHPSLTALRQAMLYSLSNPPTF